MLRFSVFGLNFVFFFFSFIVVFSCALQFSPNCAMNEIKSKKSVCIWPWVCILEFISLIHASFFRFKTEILTSSVHKINAVEVCYKMCNCYPVGVEFKNVASLPRIKEMAFKLPLKMENYCLASLNRTKRKKKKKTK